MASNPANFLDSSEVSYSSSERTHSGAKMESQVKSGTNLSNNKVNDPKKVDRLAKSSVSSTRDSSGGLQLVDPISKGTEFSTKTAAEPTTSTGAAKSTGAVISHGQMSGTKGLESSSCAPLRPHTGGDVRWDAINMVSKGSQLNLSHFRLLKRLGYGDIGSAYLVELRGTSAFFCHESDAWTGRLLLVETSYCVLNYGSKLGIGKVSSKSYFG